MSDIGIPGVGTSKYGTDKLIEGLVKVQRVPLDRAKTDLKADETRKSTWLELNQKLTSLRNDARNLYSFQNPFMARVAKSSNEEVLTASATREALEQTKPILVKQAAAADRFISADQAKDYRVPSGSYVFAVGDKSVELNYGGGDLQNFADSINRKGKDLVRASVVSISTDANTKALIIESLQTGIKNRLSFQKDAEKFAVDAGLLERVSSRAKILDPSKPTGWEGGLDPGLVRFDSGVLSLATGGQARLALDSTVRSQGLLLELKYRLLPLPEPAQPVPPPGPGLKPVGQASYGGITIVGAPSDPGLSPWSPPPSPPRVDDKVMAFVVGPDASYRALPPLTADGAEETLTVELGSYLPDISALALRNKDTGSRLVLSSARIFDPTETGGFKPKRPISTAHDAILQVDGVELTRPKNDISDVVPGVTINLKTASDKPVNLRVEPDRKAVKDALIALVGNYNRILAQVNILTRDDERLIQEITYFTDDEKKAAKDHLGLLLNDSTLGVLRTGLQNAMMNPYDGAGDLRLLAQVGISTDSQKAGASQGFDSTKMRGYLEIDEGALDKALASDFDSVRKLFGNDSDGDLIVDSGAAYKLDSVIRPYVETAGLISIRTGTIDRQMTLEKRTIDDLDKKLADYEADLKRKYAQMEGSLQQMDSTSASLTNSFNNGNGQ
jgi:flagellar hook-associated protein 2